MNRRHDIDALRALAFALVILYHVAMYYVAGWEWHLKSPHAAAWLQWPMRAINLWRMDLVFLISGLAIGFLRRGHSAGGLLRARSTRLLLPLAFGMAVVVPFQPYAQGVANGLIEPGFGNFLLRYLRGGPWPHGAFDGWEFGVTWNHLWYLPYLWFYTAMLVLLLPLLHGATGERLRRAFLDLRGNRLLLVPALPMLLYSALLWPHFPVSHDLIHDGWLHAVYFTLFIYGYWIGTDPGIWAEATRLRWTALGTAACLLAINMALRSDLTPEVPRQLLRWIGDLYMWTAIIAILGWAHHKLNRPFPWLAWANESVYPWYVLHQTITIVIIWWMAPLQLGPWLEPALLVLGTVAACWGITALVRSNRRLRPLFGLKPVPPRYPSPATPAHRSARSA